MSDEIDLSVVVAELYEEIERRRLTGDIPPGLERGLDATFAQYAPPGALGDDAHAVIERVEQSAFIDPDVPTASRNPVARAVKQVVRKLAFFYVAHVANQVSALGQVIARAFKLTDRRLARLERVTPGASPVLAAEAALLDGPDTLGHWRDQVLEACRGAGGRVLHATCGDGSLVRQLRADGADAYGVEPRRSLLVAAKGLDVRPDEPLEHLGNMADRALGAVVLSGFVERSTPGSLVELADQLGRVVAAGGRVVIVSASPEGWVSAAGPVLADLSPGRPLHEQTWRHLLTGRGFAVTPATIGPGASYLLTATRR